MFTPKVWDKISGIHNNIGSVIISLDAATEPVYNITRAGGNWSRLLENLQFLSTKYREGYIKKIRLDFVVQGVNYTDMPGFINIGKDLNISHPEGPTLYFSRVHNWRWSPEEFKKHKIWDPGHEEYGNFVQILKDPIFNDKDVDMGNLSHLHRTLA